MRNFRKSWIGIVLVFLFGLSLFFWRQGSNFSNILNSDNIVANVGNTTISTSKFKRTLDINVNQFSQILNKDLKSEEIINYQIHNLALSALINDAIFENEFNKINFKLDETIIAKKTQEMVPELYDENNKLNENFLKQFLSQQRLKIEDVVQIVHYNTRKNYFNSSLLNINLPKTISNKILNYNNHTRNIDYIIIPIDKINIDNLVKNSSKNIDELLLNYYEKNNNKYLSDEKRDIRYIKLNKNDYIETFIPTKEEILEYYNYNNDKFIEEEKRSFVQFNFQSKIEAENFINSTKSFYSLNDILKIANNEKIKFNNFKNLTKDSVFNEISESLFKLNINQISQPIKTPLAFHVIFLKDIKQKKQLNLDEVENQIINLLSNQDVDNFLLDLENKISLDILEGYNLNKLSEKYDLEIVYLNNIVNSLENFNDQNDLLVKNIINNAFQANIDFTSDIIKLNEEIFYIYEVIKINKSQPLNFKNVSYKN